MRQAFHVKAEVPVGARVALVAVFVLLAWSYWPVTRGDFVIDDYVFLATARMVDQPWVAFWQSHFYEPYYFRPVGVLSWWLAQHAFGLDYFPHALVNLGLHAANAFLLWGLLRVLAVQGWAAVAAVALFAQAPFGLGPALWPSNRFDLLATGFLLLLARLVLAALRRPRPVLPLLAAMLAAVAACWSKELAFPVATALATVVLFDRAATRSRRMLVFACLGVAIGAAFGWRHLILADAYAVVQGDPLRAVANGLSTLGALVPALVSGALGGGRGGFWLGLLALVAVLALVSGLRLRRGPGSELPSRALVVAACVVALVAIVVQAPLAGLFAPLVDGSAFGVVTYLRFYYAPWAVIVLVLALVLSRVPSSRGLSVVVMLLACLAAVWGRPLGTSFAQWVLSDVRPYSLAATSVVDSVRGDEPCMLVFLGTQVRHPYFRMFSDVTVKARAANPASSWRCFVMTESTPWLFAFPIGEALPEWPLPRIPNPDGSTKSDSTWGGVRYRYRVAPSNLAVLPGARFYEWRADRFVDVTTEVRDGTRKAPGQPW